MGVCVCVCMLVVCVCVPVCVGDAYGCNGKCKVFIIIVKNDGVDHNVGAYEEDECVFAV